MEERFLNHRGLLDTEKLAKTRFVVVGAGAIGSFFILALTKMGGRLIDVYDHDTLEDHNFANQMHPLSQIGKAKVDSIKEVAKDYGEATITVHNRPWTPDCATACDIIVSCVDNMDVRNALFSWYKQNERAKFFIDGRMSAFVYRVYGVDLTKTDQVRFYEESLFPQEKASKEPCGQKSIIFTVLAVAASMLSQVTKYLNGDYRPTLVNFDAFNEAIDKVYHETQVIETFEAEEEIKEEEHVEMEEAGRSVEVVQESR